jgi:Mrp family chromosome partitioning ATPase
VIDAASLLPVTDPTVLALHTDGALVIVDGRRSTKKQLAAAVGILDDAGARLVGVSLNKVRRRRGRRGSYPIRRPATS